MTCDRPISPEEQRLAENHLQAAFSAGWHLARSGATAAALNRAKDECARELAPGLLHRLHGIVVGPAGEASPAERRQLCVKCFMPELAHDGRWGLVDHEYAPPGVAREAEEAGIAVA